MKFPVKNIQFITALLALAAVYVGCTKGPDIKSYSYATPEPKAIFPDTGYAGFADVAITGMQFGDYKQAVKVFFGGIQADSILSCADSMIVVRVPKTAVSGKVSLQVWTHTIDSIGEFRVVEDPIVTKASKDIGFPGETVEISGKGFGTDVAKVKVNFNGTTATISEITDTLLKVILPDGFTSGTIKVSVNEFPVIGPIFRAFATLPNPVYWLSFENNLVDNMGKAAATFTYSATDGTAKPIDWADGVHGKAVKLSGTGNRGTLNNQSSNNQFIACPPQVSKYPEITVTAWVNWGRPDTTIWVQEPIFDFGQARGLRMALMTRMGTAAGPNMVGRLIFENINEFSGNVPFDAKANTALTKFKWQHVAMTISTADKIVKVYLDGVMIGSIQLTGTASPTLFNHNKVYIGAPTNGVRNEPAYGGLIDEFRIFDQALNADQIYADYFKYRP